MSMVGMESGFSLVSFLHPNSIETLSDIELSEILSTLELIDQLGD